MYSLSLSSETAQNIGQFAMNSIRMKSSLGLAGKAYTSAKVAIEPDATTTGGKLIAEEKDLAKLRVSAVSNAVAIPVLDKQSGAPIAVIMAYNYDKTIFAEQNLEDGKDQKFLWDISSLVSAVLFNVENLQGVLADNDLLSAQFNCVNEGVVMLNAELVITKMNKSAEIILNTASSVSVGKRISEVFSGSNNHLMKPVTE